MSSEPLLRSPNQANHALVEGHDTSKIFCEVSESIGGEILRGLGILEDSLGFLGILEDSKGFFGVKIMGFLRIRGDSARILGDSIPQ